MRSWKSAGIADSAGDDILTSCDEADATAIARMIFGTDAALAVAFSAIDARLDGRNRDFLFGPEFFGRLLTDELCAPDYNFVAEYPAERTVLMTLWPCRFKDRLILPM